MQLLYNCYNEKCFILLNAIFKMLQNASESLNIFKKNIFKFIRPTANNIFDYHNLKGVKYLTRLRLGISPRKSI